MQTVEIVVVLAVAAVLATTGYRVANERRDAARLASDLGAVAAAAVAYQTAGAHCGRPQGTPVEVEDMMVALGGVRSGPVAPGAWSVRYDSRRATTPGRWPPVRPPAMTGSSFELVRAPGATDAERAVLERMGGRHEGSRTVLAWRVDRSAGHRGRRSFAAGRAFTGC